MIRLFTVLFVMITSSAFAEDMTIEMLNKRDDGAKMVYSVDEAKVNVGDTSLGCRPVKDIMSSS